MLNYMVHNRGRPADYERWEKQHGLKGWGWKDVEPFYRSLENFKDGGEGRGSEGPIVSHRSRLFICRLLSSYRIQNSVASSNTAV